MANVLSLVPYKFLPARTGGQKAISQFYKYFSRNVTLTCTGVLTNDPAYADGYTLVRYLSSSPLRYLNPVLFFKIRSLLKSTAAEFLLLEHPYLGWVGWVIKASTGVRLVIRSHNIEGERWKSLGKWWWRLLWYYERFSHRQADFNLFIQDGERQYAIDKFGLAPDRCLTMTFGVERESAPTEAEKATAREIINVGLGLDPDRPVLIINGAFQYGPNLQALKDLLHHINPLLDGSGVSYQLLVCGMDIPASLSTTQWPNVKMLGFVDDLHLLLTGADVFINPVIQGGGIKTKLVEALSYGMNAVSFYSGAIGVNPHLCGGKLDVVSDRDWSAFASAVRAMIPFKADTPKEFFGHFSWSRLAAQTATFLGAGSDAQTATILGASTDGDK